MDKQKVFWVVLAVSVFVVVVLIVGVLLLRQHPAGAPRATVTPMNESGGQVYEYQRETPLTSPAGTQGAQPGSQGSQPGTSATGDQQTMHFYIGEGAPSTSGTTPGGSSATPAPSSPTGAAPSTPTTPSVSAPLSVPPAPAVSSAPTTVKPRSTRSVSAASAAAAASAAGAAPRKSTQYWIQAGAYKSQDKAEELVKLLDGKGISSRVFSYNLKSETWYRVRVGPYTNRGEAGKFLSLVKQVQGLEASYISLVSAARVSVN